MNDFEDDLNEFAGFLKMEETPLIEEEQFQLPIELNFKFPQDEAKEDMMILQPIVQAPKVTKYNIVINNYI